MSAPENLIPIIGNWVGTNRLWLSPGEQSHQSASTARVELFTQGQFVTIRYTWSEEGTPQEGYLLLRQSKAEGRVQAVWVDSWHMQDQFMICKGEVGVEGEISIRGSYAAPSGPDWGWRILIVPIDVNAWSMIMYNVSPEGDEVLAVEAAYTRQR